LQTDIAAININILLPYKLNWIDILYMLLDWILFLILFPYSLFNSIC